MYIYFFTEQSRKVVYAHLYQTHSHIYVPSSEMMKDLKPASMHVQKQTQEATESMALDKRQENGYATRDGSNGWRRHTS